METIVDQFSGKESARRPSLPVFEIDDIIRINEYKFNLWDTLLYQACKLTKKEKERIRIELINVDQWCDKYATDFTLDNNRNFKQ
jgi:hypothetical protein